MEVQQVFTEFDIPPYLYLKEGLSGKEEIELKVSKKIVDCGCKNWYCENCCRGMGWKLKKRVETVVSEWKNVKCITLTIDPKIIKDPREALEYVGRKRAIGELIKSLRRKLIINSKKYFVVQEIQDKVVLLLVSSDSYH